MQGKVIDLEKLMRQNELTPAVGNMNVNARGDEIGKGGKIVRKRDEIVAEYYSDNPNAKPHKVKPVKQETKPVESARVETKAKKPLIEE